MFWTNNKILSYNKTFNFVIGQRTGGKSYDSKNLAISHHLKYNIEIVWIRREKTELSKEFRMKFFSDVEHLYPENGFDIKMTESGATAYIFDKVKNESGEIEQLNRRPFIYFVALSVYHKHKSIPFNNVKWIIFDEFIINPRTGARYLKGETFAFFEIYHSIARPYSRMVDGKTKMIDPKTRVLFLGNSISIVNPYFSYFNIKIDLDKEFNVFDNGVVQIWDGTLHREYMETTSLGKSLEGTDYIEYAQENEFYLDNNNFVQHKTKNASYLFGFIVEGHKLGVWIDYREGLMFINKMFNGQGLVVAVDTSDHNPNLLMINYFKRTYRYKQLRTAFENGVVRYSDLNVMAYFYSIMGYMGFI